MDTASLARRVAACAVVLASVVVFARAVASPGAALGADPQTAPLKFASATITGTVSYSGTVPGVHTVWAGAFTTTQGVPPAYAITRTGPGAYTLIIATGADYYIAAGMDADDSGSQPNPPVDPMAYYAGNPISVTLSAVFSNVDILLTDAVTTGTITGAIGYSGAVTGTHLMWAAAFTSAQEGPPLYSYNRMGPGPFTLTVAAPDVYYISAGMDADDSGGAPNPPIDPVADYAGNPVTVGAGGTVSNVNIMLADTVPAGSISGTISYTGAVSSAHNVVVMAQRLGDPPGPPAYSTVIFGPGPYTITNVTQYTYTVSAFLDRGDDMGAPQPNEPLGVYDPSGTGTAAPVVVSGSATVTGIDIMLLDPYRAFLPLVVRSWGP